MDNSDGNRARASRTTRRGGLISHNSRTHLSLGGRHIASVLELCGLVFGLQLLRRHAACNGVIADFLRRHAHCAQHRVFAHPHAGHHRGVIGEPRSGANLRFSILNHSGVDRIMRMRVNGRVVRNRCALLDDQLATIVEHDVFVDDAVVLDRKVVAITELDSVKDLHVLADAS